MVTPVDQPTKLHKVYLACGIIASLVRVGTDVLAGRLWIGYSFIAQSISELSAIGAPTRTLVLSLEFIYCMLMIAFSIGIWQLAYQKTLMRIVAILIAANAIITLIVSLFIPMSLNSTGVAYASTIHVVLMAIGVFSFLIAMGLGGAAHRNWFRPFSFGIILAYFILAGVRFLVPSQSTVTLPTPTVGIQERTMVLGYLLWVVAFALLYTRKKDFR